MKFFYSLLFILLILAGCSREPIAFSGRTMGTFYNITIIKSGNSAIDQRLKHIQPQIDSVLENVNNLMSTYIQDSELSKFNSASDTGWIQIHPELMEVLDASKNISALSGGAFDITVGPLVNLWGFGPESRPLVIPSDEEIAEREKQTGIENLVLDKKENRVKKKKSDLYCDLSAIAKGFGVDEVSRFIQSQGFSSYLVEIGGEVRTGGTNKKGVNWKIGISSADGGLDVKNVITLSDVSVATSGDYRNYFEKDGIRYSHTIDPRTGKPINHKLVSVSVISQNCMEADGLATALMVLGPDEGLELAEKMNLPAYFIVKDSTGFYDKVTDEFKKFIL